VHIVGSCYTELYFTSGPIRICRRLTKGVAVSLRSLYVIVLFHVIL